MRNSAEFYEATDIESSCFVFASAGSGKTKVLVDRYVKLLLFGTDPNFILCITFTNAAAYEMETRILSLLKQLAEDKDKFTYNYLKNELNVIDLSSELLGKAHNLYGEFIDKNAKISTIHSFCQRILQNYPFEADILPEFGIMDSIDSNEYLTTAKNMFFKKLANTIIDSVDKGREGNTIKREKEFEKSAKRPNSDSFGADFSSIDQNWEERSVPNFIEYNDSVVSNVASLISSYSFEELLEKMLDKLPKFYRFFERNNILDLVGKGAEDNTIKKEKKLEKPIQGSSLIGFSSIFQNWDKGTVPNFIDYNIQEYEQKLRILFKIGKQSPNLEKLEDIVLTKTGSIRKKIPGISPELANAVYQNKNNRNKEKILKKTVGFLLMTRQIFDIYQNIKRSKNMLDFAEIINRTDNLLNSNRQILNSCRSQIRHIMIDEAQDMNTDQWRIVSYLGVSVKTIFVVGDIKQSIYGFQDANPQLFIDFHKFYKESLKNFRTVNLNICYRSKPKILSLVDNVFRDKFDNYKEHIPYRKDDDDPGIAELIFIKSPDESVPDFIENLIKNDNVTPGDIIILTRQRSKETSDIVTELERRGIPIVGPDKIILNHELIIMDIMAAAEFAVNNNRLLSKPSDSEEFQEYLVSWGTENRSVLKLHEDSSTGATKKLPEERRLRKKSSDDYALACLLKSDYLFANPLSDNDIYRLCHNRNCSVFENLQKDDQFKEHVLILQDIIDASASKSVFEFFSYIIFKLNRRDAVLNYFIDVLIKRNKIDSIEDFITWFSSNEIKTSIDIRDNASNGIMVNTIHGSKGLEAPIVILLDFSLKSDMAKNRFLWKETINTVNSLSNGVKNDTIKKDNTNLEKPIQEPNPDSFRLGFSSVDQNWAQGIEPQSVFNSIDYSMQFVIKPNKNESFEELQCMIDMNAQSEEEDLLRLLYVAMTRARDRLYIVSPTTVKKDGIFELVMSKYCCPYKTL